MNMNMKSVNCALPFVTWPHFLTMKIVSLLIILGKHILLTSHLMFCVWKEL